MRGGDLSGQVAEANPIFRWAGSKRKLIPRLASLAPAHYERYVEPFAGSAQFFFFLRPRAAVLADINGELINAYRQIRDDADQVAVHLESIPDRSAQTYYLVRSLPLARLTGAQRAARFVYLNRLCFNGLYRTNLKGEFNVPYGGDRSGQLPTRAALETVATLLANVELVEGDFELAMEKVVHGDFVYLDPPYSIANRRVFNNYSHHIFDIPAIERLRECLERLDSMNAKFLVSYGVSKEGLELGRGWNIKRTTVQRQISGFAAHRRLAAELLITNF